MKPTDVITTKSGLSVEIWQGDCLESLRAMPDNSVHCVVTSPPYWGLRDYGTGTWEGGDPECDHKGEPFRTKANINKNWGEGYEDKKNAKDRQPFKSACPKCGAIRVDKQIGLEDTPEQFIEKLVEVFREVRRVLREDGTCWVNMGDGYATTPCGSFNGGGFKDTSARNGTRDLSGVETSGRKNKVAGVGVKQKDLIGQPWMLAFALRADGWYLRQDIIWHKPNPMPESVRDRCTKAHEYIFLLTKSSRYFYDAGAIMEPAAWERWGSQTERKSHHGTAGHLGGKSISELPIKDSKNKRSVWTVATCGYPEAHFATFPPKLIEPCIKAGCPAGGTVLDPFGGSFTTAEVALKLGCSAIMCELNPEYIEMGKRRISAEAAQGNLFT